MEGLPRRVDPVTFELVKNGLMVLCDEMQSTLARAAYSPLVRETLDCSTALLTPQGELMEQGRSSPLQLGSFMAALEAIRRKFGGEERPGDVFLVNDPYEGGSHLPDLYILKPVFVQGELAAFVGVEAHMRDIGGRVPGSNACDSTEIYQEGLRIPPSHLVIAGRPNRTLWDIVEKNVRHAPLVIGDIRAMLAAAAVGERGFLKLVERYGFDRLRLSVREIMDYAEGMVRAEIARWPDGEYCFDDAIDDDGLDPAPIPIRVRLAVRGDAIEVDFTGTGRQVRAALNMPLAMTKAACYAIIRAAMPSALPQGSGFTRPIRVVAPEGTVLNPLPPAAVTARSLTAARTLNALAGALAQCIPQRMLAGDEGGSALVTMAGPGRDGKPWIFSESLRCAWGGRHDRDGVDGVCGIAIYLANLPCETTELDFPVRVRRYGFVRDACGAGKFRGGLSIVRDYEMLDDDTMVQVRSDRVNVLPYGLFGGKPGTPTTNLVNPGPGQRMLPSKFMVWLKAGDVYRCQLPGAGGWGDPLERDPALVQRDVRNEKISVAYAAREHGVVMDPASGAVDEPATAECRVAMRVARGRAG